MKDPLADYFFAGGNVGFRRKPVTPPIPPDTGTLVLLFRMRIHLLLLQLLQLLLRVVLLRVVLLLLVLVDQVNR